jgi:prepilin-type N-terminal cleavage/methylation domain-containing protein
VNIIFSPRDEQGFTFIELMLALVLMSILFLGVWGIFYNGYTFWRQAEYKVDMYDSLRFSLDMMGRELMYAKKPDGAPGGIMTPSDSSNLYFINAEGKTIQYYRNGYQLMRKEYTVPQPLASDIQDIHFAYYNGAGAEISPTSAGFPAKVRQVKITLTAKKYGSNVAPVVLVRKISLRSL